MDWELIKKEIMANNVTTGNKEKLSNFMKNSMSDIITKILDSMTRYVARIDNTFPFLKNILKKNTLPTDDKINEKISDLMGKKVLKLALREIYIIPNTDEDDSKETNDETKATYAKVDDVKAEETETEVDDGGNKVNLTELDLKSDLTSGTITTSKNEKESTTRENPSNVDDIENSNDTDIIKKPEKIAEPESILEKNVNCPPLGSPIISNNTLVR